MTISDTAAEEEVFNWLQFFSKSSDFASNLVDDSLTMLRG